MEYLWLLIVASFWDPMLLNSKKSKEILENLVTFKQTPYKNWSWKCLKITLVNDRRGPHIHNADRKFGMPRETDDSICHMPNMEGKESYESYFKVFREGSSTNDINSFPWHPLPLFFSQKKNHQQIKNSESTNLFNEYLLWCLFQLAI